jgi:hypothetical protein
MSMIDDIKRGGFTTLALGAGVLSLLPAVLPVAARGVRPLINSAIQGSLVCLEKGQEAVAEIHRMLDQVAAETRAEAHGRDSAAPETSPAPSSTAKPVMAATGEPDPEVMG